MDDRREKGEEMNKMTSDLVNLDVYRQFTIQELARMVVRSNGGDDGMGGPVAGRFTDEMAEVIDLAETEAARAYGNALQPGFDSLSIAGAYTRDTEAC